MSITKAAAHFHDRVQSTEPMQEPEKWNLYMGLYELCLGLDEELKHIKKRVDAIEARQSR